ncbi:MAG TPA: hypothetical protein DIW31_06165 [Bacteroidales bacterium]|nr:hypothetical protein [Bacteroidales bacterium]
MIEYMGIFNFFKYTATERLILNQYTQMLSSTFDMSKSEANSLAEEMLVNSISKAKKDNTYQLPPSILGEMILDDYESGDIIGFLVKYVRKTLPEKRKDGVKDEDILWWWNLDEISRRMVMELDWLLKSSNYSLEIKNNGLSEKEAILRTKKYNPTYGDPGELPHLKGDNRPLPWELRDRINIFLEKILKSDPQKYKKRIESAPSFNSFLREEIRKGNI